MAATIAARDYAERRLGKRPRTDSTGDERASAPAAPVHGVRRRFEEHKKALLAREQEREQRCVQEVRLTGEALGRGCGARSVHRDFEHCSVINKKSPKKALHINWRDDTTVAPRARAKSQINVGSEHFVDA